jgi:hypothetical protein
MKRHVFALGTIFLAILTGITSCGDKNMNTSLLPFESDMIPAKEWKNLAGKKIYIGHQSVGYNIIDGIKDIMKNNRNITLNIQETADEKDFAKGIFAHSQNGENVRPMSKVESFAKKMGSGLAKRVTMAGFKLCYIDFNKGTNAKEVFGYYKSAMDELRRKYPDVTFVHFTVPLTTEGGLLGFTGRVKDLVKKIMGRTGTEQLQALGNIKRGEYNTLLRKEFSKEPVIDLARFESTYADGKRSSSGVGGVAHDTMVPAYTSDGGHLNEKGRAWVADKMLVQLIHILKRK